MSLGGRDGGETAPGNSRAPNPEPRGGSARARHADPQLWAPLLPQHCWEAPAHVSPEFGVCASLLLGPNTGHTVMDPPGRESGPGRRPPGEGQSRAAPLGTSSSLGACVSSSPAPNPRERGPAGSTWSEQTLCPGAAPAAHRGALGHTQGAWLLEGIRRGSGSVGIQGRALVRSRGQHLVGDAWLGTGAGKSPIFPSILPSACLQPLGSRPQPCQATATFPREAGQRGLRRRGGT